MPCKSDRSTWFRDVLATCLWLFVAGAAGAQENPRDRVEVPEGVTNWELRRQESGVRASLELRGRPFVFEAGWQEDKGDKTLAASVRGADERPIATIVYQKDSVSLRLADVEISSERPVSEKELEAVRRFVASSDAEGARALARVAQGRLTSSRDRELMLGLTAIAIIVGEEPGFGGGTEIPNELMSCFLEPSPVRTARAAAAPAAPCARGAARRCATPTIAVCGRSGTSSA
jgi:hypothetical protein